MPQHRRKFQSRDFVVGALKKQINDPRTPPTLRQIAIDRLAVIDEIYEVLLAPPYQRLASLVAPDQPKGDIPEVETGPSSEDEEMLKKFNKNGGADGRDASNTQSSAPSESTTAA